MRKKIADISSDYKILILDDEIGIVEAVSVMLKRSGYFFTGVTDPLEAIERLHTQKYDMLILDYLMKPINGDEVVRVIREFDKDLYILLLTGHKDLVPPLETIKALDIQGYCEKSDRFDQLLLLIESGMKSIAQISRINSYNEGLGRILDSIPKIFQLQPVTNILNEILSVIFPLVKSENAFILVDDIINMSNNSHESLYKGIGNYDISINDFFKTLSPDFLADIGLARANNQVVKLDHGTIFPLTNEYNTTLGIIYIECADFEEGLRLFEIYSNQVSFSINNAFLHSMVSLKNDEICRTYEELKTRYIETIEALRLTVEAKDVYTRGHSDRVAYYAVKIGKGLGLSEEEQEYLRIGGIFHDIGKIGTSDNVLLKTGGLDSIEYEEMKKHPLKGAYILSAVSLFHEVVPIVKYHHERIDGKGYPEGLKGDEIPFLTRILLVADAFDSMTSDRSYRSKLSLTDAKSQLVLGSGTQFDAHIVDVFLNIVDNIVLNGNDSTGTYKDFIS